jgi:uroporphyrinogen-III decarboxylase
MDFYLHPVEVHRLNEALCGLYLGYLRRAIKELHPDGYWTSDDLGHQKQLFMSQQMFQELLKPYYVRVGNFLHENNLHWWLHSCGNNTLVLGDLVEAGVNVFHPVQKGTMDEARVAREFGGSLTFLAGVDVQHVLQEADPAGVRTEVRNLIDLFDHAEGGMCIAAGNGIVSGTPFENIEAFLDEAVRYGIKHRSQWV